VFEDDGQGRGCSGGVAPGNKLIDPLTRGTQKLRVGFDWGVSRAKIVPNAASP